MIATTTLLTPDPRLLPPATISREQYCAFWAYIHSAGQTFAEVGGDPFAVLVAAVRPFALATLAALVDYDEDAIAVLDEAQCQGRCVALTPRPDWGYSLTVAVARDGGADPQRRRGRTDQSSRPK